MSHISSIASAAALLAGVASAWPTLFSREETFINGTTNGTNTRIYDFADLPPRPDLVWTPCWEDRFTCANLEVPLDYEDESAGTTNVAFIKVSGAGGNGAGQNIYFNPGGPGGSGVQSALGGLLDQVLSVFGPGYNIISFDPRGVNNSGPSPLTCWSDAEAKAAYSQPSPSSDLKEFYAANVAYGEYCTKTNEETNVKYAGTLAVVQDIVHFHELDIVLNGGDPATTPIWYYGVSYGTVIGQTLAVTYPDRIGRMILDGNVYGKQHFTGYVSSDIDDTDTTFAYFFQYCFEAGPSKCPFAGNSSSASALETRYLNLLDRLENEPIRISDHATPTPQIITRFGFSSWAFPLTYSPANGFPILARVAADLENGNYSTYVAATSGGSSGSSAPSNPNYDDAASQEALQLITCIDANTRYPLTNFSLYSAALTKSERESIYGGESNGKSNVIICAGFGISPPASQLFPGFSKVKTASPILFVNNVADPVTPLSSALRMSDYFEDSVVLTQDTPGHGFIGIKSSCTHEHLRKYLDEGVLPEEGTVCEPDHPYAPFADVAVERKVRRIA
ncbi:hypothetical protein CC78DRAFT_609764 [Lojkania enalia]|uniref:Alpha/beta-hydrolase n=1 Tax=Lojkania enalia TaxID=147567 RepID=A0A9P4K3U9_9PLEO|nr:hypothetical protein CC78DRAFT_609764 [Didymosphaeria enalia]